MKNIILAIAVAVGTSVAAPALADVNYYGTSDRTAAAHEQNNADAGPSSARARTGMDTMATLDNASRVYGFATAAEPMGAMQRQANQTRDPYLGTSWRYQDNADARIR